MDRGRGFSGRTVGTGSCMLFPILDETLDSSKTRELWLIVLFYPDDFR